MAKAKLDTTDYEELKKIGIPVTRVVFHDTVTSRTPGHAPETALYLEHPKKSRVAKMWYTPHGLLTEQAEGYKMIPLANVKDTDLA
jgi:hypothetical protein